MSYYSTVADNWNDESLPWLEEAQHKKRNVRNDESARFDEDERADAIHKTLESAQESEESCQKLVQLLGTASVDQRQNLKQKYAAKFGGLNLKEELMKRLPASELITKELLQTLTDTPAEHDAKYLQKAMEGLGTNEEMLIEILVTRSNRQLGAIKSAYKALFNRELEKEVSAETSGTFKALLLDLLTANRDQSFVEEPEKAKKALYAAGEGRLGTDEKVFIKILANQSLRQLRLLFDEYENLTKHSIEKAIKSEFSRDSLRALLAIVEFVRNGPVGQVAKLMQKCIEGKADENLLVHLIYTYKELNLLSILADEYNQKFKGPLAQAIQNSAKSAILKNALVYLIKSAGNR
uniref:Annexin n=1 Tax=Globodera rostochiensis TaxID=31243 RepID=A0A914IDV2_GLORO